MTNNSSYESLWNQQNVWTQQIPRSEKHSLWTADSQAVFWYAETDVKLWGLIRVVCWETERGICSIMLVYLHASWN